MIFCKPSATRIATICLCLMFAAAKRPLARESWERKPFTQWDEKEARRVTSKSPWGYTRLLQWSQGGNLGGLSRSESLRREEARAAAEQRRARRLGPVAPDIRVGSGRYDDPSGNPGKAESYRVFWYSSLRARQAMGRLRQLRGLSLEQELKTLEGQCRQDYVIAVSGPVVRFFRNAELAELQSKTFLVSKKDKHKRLVLRQYVSPKVLRFPMALFLFSREADGKPVLELKDDEACFLTEHGPVRVKVSFKLKEMITDGKLDL